MSTLEIATLVRWHLCNDNETTTVQREAETELAGRHFADGIFKIYFLVNENIGISIKNSLKFLRV